MKKDPGKPTNTSPAVIWERFPKFVLGFIIVAAAAFLFIPASAAASYPGFLAALFCIGAGITVLQVAMNPVITTLGPIDKPLQSFTIDGRTVAFTFPNVDPWNASLTLAEDGTLQGGIWNIQGTMPVTFRRVASQR